MTEAPPGLHERAVRAVRRERGDDRWYEYPRDHALWPSVTTVTGGTASKPWLGPWNSDVAARFAVANLVTLVRLIEHTEAEKTAELQAAGVLTSDVIAQVARKAGEDAAISLVKTQAKLIRDLKADVGSYVHSVIEQLILWAASPGRTGTDITLPDLPEHLRGALYEGDPVEDVVDWMITGFLNFDTDFGPEYLAAEMPVFHPQLKVAGTLDIILRLAGRVLDAAGELIAAPRQVWTPCVDVKTGKHLDPAIAEQLAPYHRMPECLMPLGELVPKPPTDGTAVLWLRPEHPRGYKLVPISRGDDAAAWNRFRRALQLWHGRNDAPPKLGKPAYPLRADGSVPPRLLADMTGEGYGRAPGALARAGVEDIEALAALTLEEVLAKPGVGPGSMPLIAKLLADRGMHLAGAVAA